MIAVVFVDFYMCITDFVQIIVFIQYFVLYESFLLIFPTGGLLYIVQRNISFNSAYLLTVFISREKMRKHTFYSGAKNALGSAFPTKNVGKIRCVWEIVLKIHNNSTLIDQLRNLC